MTPPITEPVRRFLTAYIPSVPHLEALLLVWRATRAEWTAQEIADGLYISEPAAARCLDDLARTGLLVADDAPQRYRARREPAELASLLDEVDSVYARRVREVAELIHACSEESGLRRAGG